jgi:long-chain acyl-CoA synthetase
MYSVLKAIRGGIGSSFTVPASSCLSVGRELDGCRFYREMDAYDGTFEPRNLTCSEDYILTMTSGSTGVPKPIILRQQTKIDRAFLGCRDLYGLSQDEVIITASPMYHSLGQRLVLLPLIIGGTSVIIPRFTPDSWLKAIEVHRVTFTIAVSSHLERLVKHPGVGDYDIKSLRVIVSSSALLSDKMKRACIEMLGCDFHECYGTSEIGIATSLSPEDCGRYLNSVGKALPYVSLKIMDENRNERSVGQVGEIACKTVTRFTGYYKRPEETAESEYFYTGDLGYLDGDGFLYLCGRKKELIIVGGTNVYPKDVEEVINAHPDVKESAVIGVEDLYFGEVVIAVLVPENRDVDIRAIQRLCTQELADYQQPMAYEILLELPRNGMGKLMKHKLREQFAAYDATAVLRKIMNNE